MLGVSQSTVSRAFSPTASISEKKRKMVMDAAAKLGYTPNAIARGLISNRSGLVAIALDSESNPMYDMQSRALAVEIQKRGGQVVLCPIDKDDLDLAISRAIEYQVDGLVIATSRLTSRAFAQCEKFGVHLSLINRYAEGINANSSGIDNRLAGQQAAEYLTQKGAKQCAYISGDAGSMTSEERWLGFSSKLQELGAPSPTFIQAKYSFEAGLDAAKEILSHTSKPDAIFCANDILAMGVMDGLRQAGAKIPQDFSVMGVDNIPMSAWPSYDLTTIAQPVDKIVKRAVEDLMNRINGNLDATGEYLFEQGTLLERSSTT
ncbi:substrate-binding domain-containing protein [Vibrio alginolyticus]|uniref:LacI family DNA-binding transcriptional regulator n=1 Tax=Vibrio alginolyticus TaxID=663 RepID=UPI001BD52A30|nr:substrate-binding domain-containing protein [Vibrio alginolyticus]EIO9263791.1 substrate-binding domain-containing protein [Vibrio alginolyticus]ELB2946521.1 substrate-binding domain-containing protein [Vibrio alginolyticus]MBT0084270.1 substrate-binding domain-containing protein [Vibrio alginolyticus]MCR9484328.1 substrate-binding domain-containing protein [Vibrio alginolyticus]